MATIILTGGGSAGHVTPHLAILPYLKNDFDKIYYIGSKNGIEKNIIENIGIPYYPITTAKLIRKFNGKNFLIPFKVLTGINEAGKILDKLKPNVIFSKGGYVSVPVVMAAKKRKIPIVSHESDYSIGLANKIAAKYSKRVLTSFPDTAKEIKKGEFVGSPIRKNLIIKPNKELYAQFGFKGDKPILLIIGGSQGSKAINDIVRQSINDLLKDFDIIHICGKGNLDCEINKKGYFQVEYMNNIENAFTVASVCVSRAGSNSIFELASLKKPCVLIPLPKGISRGDQTQNALYFEKLGLASVLQQESLTSTSLITQIYAAYRNNDILQKNFAKNPVKDASRIISRILADSAQ